MRIESVILGEKRSHKIQIEILGEQEYLVGLGIFLEARALDENVGPTSLRGSRDSIGILRRELGSFGLLECLLSISNTFKIEGIICITNELIHQNRNENDEEIRPI